MTELKENKIIAGKKYFEASEVMKYLEVSYVTFRKYKEKAGIKPIRIGLKFYLTEEDLEKLIRAFSEPKQKKAGIFGRR
jgi:selenocysteine lyase/cysteine desulfurase